MATFIRDYQLSIYSSVAIDAETEEEAERIFRNLEDCDGTWYYFKNEVFDRMMEYLVNNEREVVMDLAPCAGAYQDEEYREDIIDHTKYIGK